MQLLPSHVAPAFKAVTPNSPNNPALKPIEKLSYMGFAEVVTPSSYDGVDGMDELEDGQRNASVRPSSNGIHERLDRLVFGEGVDVHLRLLLYLSQRQ